MGNEAYKIMQKQNEILEKVIESQEVLAANERTRQRWESGRVPYIDPSNPANDLSFSYQGQKRSWGPIVYESMGQQLLEVRDAFLPGGRTTSELEQFREERTLAEGVGSSGGFLLQDNFSDQLIESVFNQPDLLGKVNKFSLTTGNNIKIPAINETSRADGSRGGGVQMYWKAEGALKTESEPDFRQIELTTRKLIGLIYATDEVLEDAAVLERYIRRAFTQEMRFKIIDALINGTGAGMPLGILASPCLVTQAAETGQASATICYENTVKMYSRMPATSRQNAVWHCNQDVEPQLYDMGITIGLGGQGVFMPAGGISGLPYNTLFGRPIIPLEQCQTIGTKGDIYFCDWSKYIAIDRGGMQSAVSIHVKFTEDITCFRFVYRFDGQPELASAITPYSGSGNTLSPFITLAARP